MRRSALVLLAVSLAACGGLGPPTPAVAEQDLDAILFRMSFIIDDPHDPPGPPTYADSASARFARFPEAYVGPLRARIRAAWDRTPLLSTSDGAEWDYLDLRYLLARADTTADRAVSREEIRRLVPVALDSLSPRALDYWQIRTRREPAERDSAGEAFVRAYGDVEATLHCAFVGLGRVGDASAAPVARRVLREAPPNTKIHNDAAAYLYALDDDPALRRLNTCGHRP